MRTPATLLSLVLFVSATLGLPAQDPGAQQDAEAAREKLLKASDELDNIQANSEATKLSVDGMKTDVAALQGEVTRLQSDNAALRQQVADLQGALDQFKEEQTKARQTLIDNVAGMIAAGKSPGAIKPVKKKKEAATSETNTEISGPNPSSTSSASSLAPPPDTTSSPATSSDGNAGSPAPVKPQKRLLSCLSASGETLTLICAAYRDKGVNVTVSEIRKANDLTEKSVLKTGQKLFYSQARKPNYE